MYSLYYRNKSNNLATISIQYIIFYHFSKHNSEVNIEIGIQDTRYKIQE